MFKSVKEILTNDELLQVNILLGALSRYSEQIDTLQSRISDISFKLENII